MTASLKPDVLNYAWRDYGVRVGIWRIMEILERQGFVATAALNAEVCEQYPEIVKAGNRLGWEWMAHGPNNSMLFTGMPEEAERPIIAGVLDTIAKQTGKRAAAGSARRSPRPTTRSISWRRPGSIRRRLVQRRAALSR